jgi:hypothetical protein
VALPKVAESRTALVHQRDRRGVEARVAGGDHHAEQQEPDRDVTVEGAQQKLVEIGRRAAQETREAIECEAVEQPAEDPGRDNEPGRDAPQ